MILDDKKYIAKKIKEYRKKNGLTQAELAEKIGIGTKQISRIEIAEFYPSLNTFFKIVETLNMDLNDFITKTPNEKNKIRKKLINQLYNATDEELSFYDRLITFANDESAELKKNILLKRVY
ncbi:MAG: helix-turn-helix domain-containing protein [Candidatus Gastranaerophilales bacterium]|nr:helix-turn-helix domain-containing protein [Candidatus Gastranaerophilales bacterium]